MKIMVCHDGSKNAQEALDKTIEMFKPLKPEIILITVVEVPLDASIDSEEIFQKWREDRHVFLMKKAKEVTDSGLEVDAILAVGDPRRMIPEAADNKKPDILAVGKRGGGGVTKMVLGSVSAFLVRHAHCPVLVFHEGG
ncbi:MAG: hypothetical protein A2Y48_04410 [Nitrospirae bacterium RIFCSPLOW2_12_42_9]|nr:MAG: hypothetical protein A2Z60_03795 [Nitrospirae bacterium RIFCSPLOWO2_02_42_7]OGW59002.1 MAG: hypothetical protein A2Y48_04410 [Nitrospirae bacterium RIFCSPLOW2_12_42_9]HBI22904.1 universal stress protein [Nitrospiraceae bacterium]